MRTTLLFLLAALAGGCAQLGGEASGGATAAAGSDAALFRDIAQANLADISAGKLAVRKARSPALRQFGKDMVQAHTSLQTEGAALAATRGMSVPTSPAARQQAALQDLQALPAMRFERAFMARVLEDQADTLALLERTAAQAQDPALRAHAQRALPGAHRQLESARRIASAMGQAG